MSQSAFPGGPTRSDPDLSERQRRIFVTLLRLHGQTARPVGSEVLAQQAGVSGSPASIRGALAELESMGLLQRAHASSGRMPSAAGYAFYVRNDLTPMPLPADLLRQMDERLRRSSGEVAQLLAEASKLLSEMVQQLGLAVAAALDGERLARLELAALGPQRALLVLGFAGGAARGLVLELRSPLDPEALKHVEAVLAERLVGLPLGAVRERLASDPGLPRDTAVRIVADAVAARWSGPAATTLFSAGAGHIASQPEFASGGRLAPVLRVLENGSPLDRLMVESAEGQAAVQVALDEDDDALAGLGLVSFPLPGSLCGAVGVLGPLRMDYAWAMSVVDAVGSRVAGYL
jgi:heat-inducible transcriptional repressor